MNKRDEAREYFENKGLTYESITADDLEYLRILLDEKFIRQKKELFLGKKGLYWDHMHSRIKSRWNQDRTMATAYLTAKGAYFDDREVISFNYDGFIGFCGAADSQNTEPVLEAFREWCDYLEERNNAQ